MPDNRSISGPDEAELCRKLTEIFNKHGFKFEFINSYVDLKEPLRHILIEVKKDDFSKGLFQVLYAAVKEEEDDTQFIGVADSAWVLLYKYPGHNLAAEFVKSNVGAVLSNPPSTYSGNSELIDAAAKFLEDRLAVRKSVKEIEAHGLSPEDLDVSEFWLNAYNVLAVYNLFNKYGANPSMFLRLISDIGGFDEIIVKDNYIVVMHDDKPRYIKIKNGPISAVDKWFITRLRIKDADTLERIRHELDKTREDRADSGAYYTDISLSHKVARITRDLVNPDWVGEPTAGAGALLEPFIDFGVPVWANDYADEAYQPLKGELEQYGFIVTKWNIIDVSEAFIINLVGKAKRPLFITNPPFSSSSGKASKDKISYGEKKYSRKINGEACHNVDLGDIYGRGNQIYPIIGKIIEVIRGLGRGYLAFFSPFGIFCERKGHMKFLSQLLNNFEFLDGYVFSGNKFNNVSGNKPIAFTIWKYGGKTNLERVSFKLEDGTKVGFKRYLLLKDGWIYNNNVIYNGDMVIPRNDYFSCPQKKILGHSIKNGSELSFKNVKFDLNIANIPSELIYGLWSIVVGNRAIVKHPLHFDNAYVHIPDFSRKESLEILAYALLYAFVEKDYTGKRLIGFCGPRKILKFGKSKRLTDGAKYLFKTYGHLSVGDKSISDILDELKRGNKDKSWKKLIREEISKRLDIIGYWDYVPLPLK